MANNDPNMILALFLGEDVITWSLTCTAARKNMEQAIPGLKSKCRCELRFEFMMKKVAQGNDEIIPSITDLRKDASSLPLSLFWHTRIRATIQHIDMRFQLPGAGTLLLNRGEFRGRLKCRCCQSLSKAVWERRSEEPRQRMFYCEECMQGAHKEIKHGTATEHTYKSYTQEMAKIFRGNCRFHHPNYGLVISSLIHRGGPSAVWHEAIRPVKKLRPN